MDASWIEWAGGECPVPPDTVIEVRFREGNNGGPPSPAGWWDWGHSAAFPDDYEILAYRVVPAADTPEDGPGEEDGPWAPGWEDRTGETRQKFETWIRSAPFAAHCEGEKLERDNTDGGYVDAVVHAAWRAWNALGES